MKTGHSNISATRRGNHGVPRTRFGRFPATAKSQTRLNLHGPDGPAARGTRRRRRRVPLDRTCVTNGGRKAPTLDYCSVGRPHHPPAPPTPNPVNPPSPPGVRLGHSAADLQRRRLGRRRPVADRRRSGAPGGALRQRLRQLCL